jgi:hypothetical protein
MAVFDFGLWREKGRSFFQEGDVSNEADLIAVRAGAIDIRPRPPCEDPVWTSNGPPHPHAGFCALNRDSRIQSQRTSRGTVLVVL